MKRIWELDAFRGICILGVIVVHTVFDLRYFVGLQFSLHPLFRIIMDYGGVLFVLLSGVCVTLGSRSVRRGLILLCFAYVITAVAEGMIALGMAGDSVHIWFGILHLLGVCMLLYPLYRRLPTWAMAALGAAIVVLGYWFQTFRVEAEWLFPLGLCSPNFSAGDYFPLFPHLGWYMLGTVLGRTVYRERKSLLPKVPQDIWPVRFFSFCGRQSLWIYLAHQPVVYGALTLGMYIMGGNI